MRTARHFVLLIAAALLAGCGGTDRREPKAADTHPALWEVADANGAVEGWLFGTVHKLPKGLEWRTPKFDAVVRGADLLVVEVSSLADREVLATTFCDLAYDDPGPPLETRVSPELRRRYAELADRSGMGRADLDRMESWAAALTLAQLAQVGEGESGADRALLADFRGGRVVELEGARAQLSIFDRLPETEQRDLLDAVIEESREDEEQARRMTDAWRRGDETALGELTRTGMLADPELHEALLSGRNRAWADRLDRIMAGPQKPLVAVGAAHMIGPDGLPALIEAKGYRVRRIQ